MSKRKLDDEEDVQPGKRSKLPVEEEFKELKKEEFDDPLIEQKAREKSGLPPTLILSIEKICDNLKIGVGFRAEGKMRQCDIKQALTHVGKPIFISTKSIRNPASPGDGHITNIAQLGRLENGIPVKAEDASIPGPLKTAAVAEPGIDPGLIQETITLKAIKDSGFYGVEPADKVTIFTPIEENKERVEAWEQNKEKFQPDIFVVSVKYKVEHVEPPSDTAPLKVSYSLTYADGHSSEFKPFTIFAFAGRPITGDADPFGVCTLPTLDPKFSDPYDTLSTDIEDDQKMIKVGAQRTKLILVISEIIKYFHKKLEPELLTNLLEFIDYAPLKLLEDREYNNLAKKIMQDFGLAQEPPGRGSALQVFVFQLINATYRKILMTTYSEEVRSQGDKIIPEVYRIIQHFAENYFDDDPLHKTKSNPTSILWVTSKTLFQPVEAQEKKSDCNSEIRFTKSEEAICNFLLLQTGVMRLSQRWSGESWDRIHKEMESRSRDGSKPSSNPYSLYNERNERSCMPDSQAAPAPSK